jgi:major membrane immunogen (membrane-anchored lipoprotein)
MKKLIALLVVAAFVLTGCARSTMTSRKTLTDGTVIEYEVKISSVGQDFSGSDLVAELDPEGKTMVKAGTVDNTMSQYSADVAKSFVEIFKIVLPYIAATAPTPIP